MKIALVANEFFRPESGKTGGLGNYLWKIAKSLAYNGSEIYILVLASENLQIQSEEEGITVLPIILKDEKPGPLSFWINRFSVRLFNFSYIQLARLKNNSLQFAEQLVKYHHMFGFDIVQYPNLGGFSFHHPRHIPYAIRLSGLVSVSFQSGKGYYGMSDSKARALIYWERKVLDRAWAIFSPSRAMLGHVRNTLGKKLSVIESPIFDYQLAMDEIRLPQTPFALYFGTIDQRKGCDLIIKAMEGKADPSFTVAFAGRFLGNSDLDKWIKEKILDEDSPFIYLGELNKGQLKYALQHAKFVILPSRSDNFPNTLIESMYFEKVVIGPNTWGFEQMITSGENGILIEPENLGQLQEAIENLLSMPKETLLKMGKNAKKATEKLSPQIICEQMISFYEDVIAEWPYSVTSD